MPLTSEEKDRRIRLFWYLGLLLLPLLVIAILMNQDPYHRVQLNKVLEMRKELKERGVGEDVIAYLDQRGGRNLTAEELADLQEADSQTIFFMLNSAQLDTRLRNELKRLLKDAYITRGEARRYDEVARQVLTDKGLYGRLGYLQN